METIVCVSLLAAAVILIAEPQSLSQIFGKPSSAFGKLPLTKFYETPEPLPLGNPGDLIRSAAFDQYYLPIDVNAVRILYHSRSATAADVAVSGVVLFPQGTPPAGGWPVIAWAHSWTGVGRACAPSLTNNLQHGPFLSMYVHLGYAVVASDYAGLGTRSRSAFDDMSSNATDVIYSVAAAREALPQLGRKWVAMGTAEGAAVAIAVGEAEHVIGDANYLGGVSISPVSGLQDFYAAAGSSADESVLLLVYGIKTLYPEFKVNDILTDKGLSLYQRVDQACGAEELAPKHSSGALLRPKWQENKFVQSFFDRNRLGSEPAAGPLLVLASEDDPSLSEPAKIVTRLCQAGDRIQFQKYPSDRGRVIGDSARDQIAWIRDRFAGRQTRSNCSQSK